jgi:hypothetical protein
MQGVGLCAIFSQQGDWAFDYALWLARKNHCRLNIFHFLESPYTVRRDVVFVDEKKQETVKVTPDFIAKKDKDLRMTYDDRLGDYTDVGFRLCEGNDEVELRRCFRRGEYDVLVIGYQKKGAKFGGTTTIDEFAAKFHAPVILVGPDAPDHYFINQKAKDIIGELNIPEGKWELIAA